MNRRWIIAIAALALLAAGGFWFAFGNGEEGAEQALTPVTAAIGSIEETVTAQGKLEPKTYVDVGTQVSGQLEKLHVELGQSVKTGDLIAEIDPQLYEASVQANEARLKTLKAQRKQQEAEVLLARQILNRNRTLIKVKAVSQEAFQQSEAALKVAEAQVQALDAQIEEAQSTLEGNKANLQFTRIFAPIDGTIVSQTAREGQTLNANQTAPIIVQVANLDVMTVRAQVAEADITKIKEGMPVYFTTLGSKNRRWEGEVRQILPTPETINDVVLYNVLVDVGNEDRQLMTSMSTQMFFVLNRAENVVTIPASALVKRLPEQDGEKGTAYQLRVLEGKKPMERTVWIGATDRTHAQVREGLTEGETILLPSAAAPKGNESNRMRMPRL